MQVGRDPRWVVLTEAGEYSIIGRYREPGPDEISAAEDALSRAGRRGWIAIMSQSEHSGGSPEFLPVRSLLAPIVSFEDAVRAFLAR